MYQEWFKEYEKIINAGKKETEYCPMCGRKLMRNSSGRNNKDKSKFKKRK